MKKAILIITLLTLTLVLPAAAQQMAQLKVPQKQKDVAHGGLGFSYYMPKGTLKESHDSGYGLSLMFAYPGSDLLDLSGSVAWSQYKVNDQPGNTLQGSEDFTVWEFTAGTRLKMNIAYLGLEAGYFTNFDEFALVPNAGIRWRIFDLSYRIKVGEDTEVHSVRVGVFF